MENIDQQVDAAGLLVHLDRAQFLGRHLYAERLLHDDRLLMVFPEGARGTAKLYWERNSLVEFGSGFVRLALATNTPIILGLGWATLFPVHRHVPKAAA